MFINFMFNLSFKTVVYKALQSMFLKASSAPTSFVWMFKSSLVRTSSPDQLLSLK